MFFVLIFFSPPTGWFYTRFDSMNSNMNKFVLATIFVCFHGELVVNFLETISHFCYLLFHVGFNLLVMSNNINWGSCKVDETNDADSMSVFDHLHESEIPNLNNSDIILKDKCIQNTNQNYTYDNITVSNYHGFINCLFLLFFLSKCLFLLEKIQYFT